jgi:hypothetical protein
MALAIAACSGGSADPQDEIDAGGADADLSCNGATCLDPEDGFTVETSGVVIDPGQDVEYCEVLQLPGSESDVYYVKRLESQMTPGSHHLIVSAATEGVDGDLTVGDRFVCPGGVLGPEYLPVTGSQSAYREETFPAGVGRVFRGGQKIVVNYHYLNATDTPLDANVQVAFHLTDESEITYIAQSFGFYNTSFSIPPGAKDSVFTQCNFSEEITIGRLTRHTHRWGTDFRVWFAGGEHDGELVFHSEHYEDTEHDFDTPIVMSPGTGFRFECAYENTESYPLTFGLKASDEMCILFGTWWSEGNSAASQGCFR